MADKQLGVETLSELQIWIEGKFALIQQAQTTAHSDLTNVRSRLHDLSNEIAKVTALNIPEKLQRLQDADKEHQTNIDRFIKESAERKGIMSALKGLYVVLGGLIGWLTAVFFKIGGVA